MGGFSQAEVDAAERIERTDMVESLVIDLMQWAMQTDTAFAEEQHEAAQGWLEDAHADLKERPSAQAAARLRVAETFMRQLGIAERPSEH